MKGRNTMTTTTTDKKTLTLEYLNAVAHRRYDKVEALLAPDLELRGPARTLGGLTLFGRGLSGCAGLK